MRSVRFLAPTLPAIDGVVDGRGRIVSADLRTADVRGMAFTWTDAAGNVSSVSGDARVGFGLKVPTLNLALVLDPISMAALARIDTTIAVRSTWPDGWLPAVRWIHWHGRRRWPSIR